MPAKGGKKAEGQAQAPGRAETAPEPQPMGDADSKKKKNIAGKKLSREALALINTAFAPEGSAHRDRTPSAAAPVPGSGPRQHQHQDDGQQERVPPRPEAKPSSGSKRQASTQPGPGSPGPGLAKKAKSASQPGRRQLQPASQPAEGNGDVDMGSGGVASGAGKVRSVRSDPGQDQMRKSQPCGEQYPGDTAGERRANGGADAQASRKPAKGNGVSGKARKAKVQAPAADPQGPALNSVAGTTRKEVSPNEGKLPAAPGYPYPGATAEQLDEEAGPSQPVLKPSQAHLPGSLETHRGSRGDASGGTAQPACFSQEQGPAVTKEQKKPPGKKAAAGADPLPVQDRPRRDEHPPSQDPAANPAQAPAAEQRQLSNDAAGAAGSRGSPTQHGNTVAPTTAVPQAAGIRSLPPTGTTPVKAFAPIPIPRLDEIGRRERNAVNDLQRQLSEMRALYDELKATKIQELETVLAEQAEFADEQVRHLEHKARLWQAAAEAAEQKALAAGSQETANRINELEITIEQLKREKAELVHHLGQQSREMSQLQQTNHDLRAQLQSALASAAELKGKLSCAAPLPASEAEKANAAADSAREEAGMRVDGSDKGPSRNSAGSGPSPSASVPAVSPPKQAGSTESAGDLSAHGGRLQFPTPSPGIGTQFPTPAVKPSQPQGTPDDMLSDYPARSGSHTTGVVTACQRAIGMLPDLREPSPVRHAPSALCNAHQAVEGLASPESAYKPHGQGHQQQNRLDAGLATLVNFAAAVPLPGSPSGSLQVTELSTRAGVSTEMRRIVGMLPNLRLPTPSGEPHVLARTATVDFTGGNELQVSGATPQAIIAPVFPPDTGARSSKDRRSSGSPIDGICAGPQPNATSTKTGDDISLAHVLSAPEVRPLPVRQEDRYSFVDLNPASAQKGTRKPCPQLPQAGASLFGVGGTTDATVQQAMVGASSPLFRQRSCMATDKGIEGPIRSGSVASNRLSGDNTSGFLARAAAQQEELQQRELQRQDPQPRPSAGFSGLSAKPVARSVEVNEPARQGMRTPLSAGKCQAASLARDAPVQTTGTGLQAEESQVQHPNPAAQADQPGGIASSPLPSPGTLDWHVEVLSVKPAAWKLTHKACGISFELREGTTEDQEADAASHASQPQAAVQDGECLTYTPLDLRGLEDKLPEYMQDVCEFLRCQQHKFFKKVDLAVKVALGVSA